MTVVWGLKAAMGEVDAVSLPPVPEPRGNDPAAFVEALSAAVTAPLTEELRLLRQSNEKLLERLEALEQRQSKELEETTGATKRLTDSATEQQQETHQVEQPELFPEPSQSEEAERAAELERTNERLLAR